MACEPSAAPDDWHFALSRAAVSAHFGKSTRVIVEETQRTRAAGRFITARLGQRHLVLPALQEFVQERWIDWPCGSCLGWAMGELERDRASSCQQRECDPQHDELGH